jgi:hypothetical protein
MRNTKKYILEGLLYFILYICYKKIIGAHSALILIAIFALYAGSIVVSDFARKKLIYFEKQNNITTKKLFYLSILILCPIYLFWFLISIIPIPSYEFWLITGFPIILLSSLPIYVLSEYWKSALKMFFWFLQLFVYCCFFAIGQFLADCFWVSIWWEK